MSEFKSAQELLARNLDGAGGLRLIRVGWLERNRVVMTFDWQGKELQVTSLITEILRDALPKYPKHRVHKYEGVSKRATDVFRSRKAWTEWDLRRLDYPLYWNEEWLTREFKRLGSFAAIKREYGYPENSVSHHAAKHYKWRLKPRRGEAKKAVIETWLKSGRQTKLIWLRDQFGVSLGSVHNWLEEYKLKERQRKEG